MASCVGVSRVILVVLNILLFFIGASITAVGLLVRFSPESITDLPLTNDELIQEINGVINSTFVNIAAWVCVGIGVIIIIVSLCGCLGSAFTKSTLLGIYIFVILQIIVLQVSIGIIIYLSPTWFNTTVDDAFETHLTEPNSDISIGWNVLQLSVGCCGVNGSSSYTSLGAAGFDQYKTCCAVPDKSEAAVMYLNDTIDPEVGYTNENACKEQFTNLFTNPTNTTVTAGVWNDIGCVDKIYQTIQMLAIILIAVVAIEIFIFIISCVVCCSSPDEKAI